MTRTPSLVVRAAAACAGAVVLVIGGAGSSQAGGLPDPVGTLGGTVTGAVAGALGGTASPLPLPSTLPLPTGSTTGGTGSGSAPRSQTGSTAPGDTTAPRGTSASPGSGARPAPGAAAGKPAASKEPTGVRAKSDVATACLIPTGTASPAFEVDLAVADHDLSSPLVQQFPQVFTSCPPSTVPAGKDTVLAADATVRDLVGACVRLSRSGLPGRTTIVVLDRNLIDELTAVGLPLDQLLVPCPAAAATGGGHTAGPSTTGATPAADDPSQAATFLPARLAFTGADVLPPLVAAACLLWLGSLLLRAAARLAPATRRS